MMFRMSVCFVGGPPGQRGTIMIPKVLYGLQNTRTTGTLLKDADRTINHTPDAVLHANIRDGGLGVMQLRTAILQQLLNRVQNLQQLLFHI